MAKRAPKLLFTEEERALPELKKAIRKADKSAEKLEKAEAKIPKKTVRKKTRETDPETGKVKTRLYFEEVDKKRPVSKLTHEVTAAPVNLLDSAAHRKIRESEDENVGVESAHRAEEVAETGVRLLESAHRSHQLKPYRDVERAEVNADRDNLRALYKTADAQNGQSPQTQSNPYSKWRQKQAIKKEYAAAKAGKTADNTVKASEATAKAARQAAEESKKTGEFIAKHRKGLIVLAIAALLLVLMLGVISSCSVMFQGGTTAFGGTTYPSEDAEMLDAEARYTAWETELSETIREYEMTRDYDEYRYELDEIGHDPYALISILSAKRGEAWTADEAEGILRELFGRQYRLEENVQTETRYRTETRTGYRFYTDPDTGELFRVPYEYEVSVPYTYRICTVKLTSADLPTVAESYLSEDEMLLYTVYMETKGNRPDLFETE